MSDTIAEVRFGSDQEPGIRRTGTKRFSYLDDVTGKQPGRIQLERIRALAIPPAWTDVWISRDPLSHVQATGRDARGRKQYRYHPQFTAETAEQKFADLLAFAEVLGPLRRRVDRDLRRADLGHDQIVATIVRLLDATALRVGNEQYARSNGSFGLTTLRNRHATVRGSTVRLAFRGKSAHRFDVTVDSPRLARIVRRTQHLPGQALFEYRTPDGDVRPIGSADVNRYLAEHGHPGVTARDVPHLERHRPRRRRFRRGRPGGSDTDRTAGQRGDRRRRRPARQHPHRLPHELHPSDGRRVVPRAVVAPRMGPPGRGTSERADHRRTAHDPPAPPPAGQAGRLTPGGRPGGPRISRPVLGR